MNKKEVAHIVKIISTYYGHKFKTDDPAALLEIWHDFLKDYEFEEIKHNLKEYMKTNNFPPAVSDLLKIEQVYGNRAIPSIEETKVMLAQWEEDRKHVASKEVRERELAKMRKILGRE